MNNSLHLTQDLGASLVVVTVPIIKRHDQIRNVDCQTDEDLVEFYDASFIKEPGFQPYGQYIGSYCKSELITAKSNDLIINSRVPQWFVEQKNLIKISNWLSKDTN